ncbi:unnamed protein product [Boreogadus saida]
MNWSLHWFIDTNTVRPPGQGAAEGTGGSQDPTATPAGGPAPTPRPRGGGAWLRGEGGVVQPAGVQEGPAPGPGSCRSQ